VEHEARAKVARHALGFAVVALFFAPWFLYHAQERTGLGVLACCAKEHVPLSWYRDRTFWDDSGWWRGVAAWTVLVLLAGVALGTLPRERAPLVPLVLAILALGGILAMSFPGQLWGYTVGPLLLGLYPSHPQLTDDLLLVTYIAVGATPFLLAALAAAAVTARHRAARRLGLALVAAGVVRASTPNALLAIGYRGRFDTLCWGSRLLLIALGAAVVLEGVPLFRGVAPGRDEVTDETRSKT
jgi:hypothetical protein